MLTRLRIYGIIIGEKTMGWIWIGGVSEIEEEEVVEETEE